MFPNDTAWADIGAGDGLFTRVLARLVGPNGTVYAIDRDAGAIDQLTALAASVRRGSEAPVKPLLGDVSEVRRIPPVDGALLANMLHFVPRDQQGSTLSEVAARLRPAGRIVVIEYDNRAANRWVPYPISRKELAELAGEAGLDEPDVTATRPSAYGGILYVAALKRE